MRQHMQVLQDHPLKTLNSLNVQAIARQYVQVYSLDHIREWCQSDGVHKQKYFVLGGGTNTLFVGDFEGTILHVNLKGIEVIKQDEEDVTIKAAAGELWDDLVQFSVRHGYWGLENLSMIPGTVGGAAVQNVGAYGTDLSLTLKCVEAINVTTGKCVTFDKAKCQMGYRSSIFKEDPSCVITSVIVTLSKQKKLCLEYTGILDTLKPHEDITLDMMRNAIGSLRQKKLPDPNVMPNAGSFFKNPIITMQHYMDIKRNHPDVVCFQSDNCAKVSAAWLIDRAGCRILSNAHVGLYKSHALVLVNFGQATGFEVFSLSKAIKNRVADIFDIKLSHEVVIVK